MNTLMRKKRGYANNLTAWVPQFWAVETLAILNERLFAANTVHRNFEPIVAKLGDVVNTRRPAEYTAKRKSLTDSVTIQDSSATNIQVPLNQHIHTSILLRDGEMSKGMKQMADEHMKPAAISLVRKIDRIIFGQYAQFLNNGIGGLGQMTSNNAKDYVLNVRQRLDEQKAWEDGRNLVLNPKTETDLLRPEWFTSADKRGDTIGLRNGNIGEKFGFMFWKSLNMPNVLPAMTTTSRATAAAVVQGASVVTHAAFGAALQPNSWVTVDGLPNIVGATGTTTSTNLRWAVTRPIAATTTNVVSINAGAAINNAAGYATGWDKEITIDGTTGAPRVGQAVTFGTTPGSAIYTVVDVNGSVGIELDRPLEETLADNAVVNFGPDGAFNLAYHKNAIAFVNRPLETPDPETGVKAAVMSDAGISLRVTMQYQGMEQGMLITFDLLCGIKILDNNLGAVLLA